MSTPQPTPSAHADNRRLEMAARFTERSIYVVDAATGKLGMLPPGEALQHADALIEAEAKSRTAKVAAPIYEGGYVPQSEYNQMAKACDEAEAERDRLRAELVEAKGKPGDFVLSAGALKHRDDGIRRAEADRLVKVAEGYYDARVKNLNIGPTELRTIQGIITALKAATEGGG
jgi:hypothetical protein